MSPATSAAIVPGGDELTPAEVGALEDVEQLDSGTLAERLADTADDIASGSRSTPADLRELAALALALARRFDATVD